MTVPGHHNLLARCSRYLTPETGVRQHYVKVKRYPAQIYTTMQVTATDSSHLLVLPFSPLLLVLYLHLIALATLPSPKSMPAIFDFMTNTDSERASRHREYYIEGADLIIRVRVFTIESSIVSFLH
jgi:hypothetical protein